VTHKDLQNQRSVKMDSATTPQPKIYAVHEDLLTIRLEASSTSSFFSMNSDEKLGKQ